jgi:hypothetical protein
MSRNKLPYRETSDCFLLYKNKIVCLDNKTYLSFPGGGVDKGESPEKAAKRECKEEIGAKLKSLKHVITVTWDWFPEWVGDSEKRKERYKKFRGEKIHLFIGEVKEFGKPTSTEGDAWTRNKLMSIKTCLKLHEKYGLKDHPNTYPYRIAQYTVIKMLYLL